MNTIRVILPQKYDLVTNDTFQLFYRGVVEAPNPFCYDIVAICEKGKNFPRYFEFTPEEPGEYTLTISVYDIDKTLLGQGKTRLCVATPSNPQKSLNILCIGDSLTAGGEWVAEASRRLTAQGGEPEGLGFSGISFIGNCKKGDVGYEGFGGWRWESYFPSCFGAMWVIANAHNKNIEDQHSLWQDANGSVWQLETLAGEYLKFNRHMNHQAPIPESSALTHYKNATHKETIVIERNWSEKPSPFYDAETATVDFGTYCVRNDFPGIDAVYIFLGTNGLSEAYTAGISIRKHCQNLVACGKKLVLKIHEAYPKAQIRIMGLLIPSVNGGTGTSYGATPPYCDTYGLIRFVLELNRAYENWTLEPKYRDFMEFINLSGQFDADYNMPSAEKPVNTRNKATELVGTNGVHPTYEGYMQIADAAYRSMVHLCQKI